MSARTLALLTLASLSIFGCSTAESEEEATPPSSESNQTETQNPQDQKNPVAIVWVQAQDKVSTYLDKDGKSLSSARTFEIAKGKDVLTMKTQQAGEELGCDYELADGRKTHYDGRYQAFGISLEGAGTTQTLIALAPKPSPDEMVSLHQGGDIVGSVGPYVFVREEQSGMACGAAHGGRSVKSFIWNVETGSKQVIQTPNANVLAANAEAQLAGRGGFEGGALHYAEMIPSFDDSGTLHMKYRFEKEACYACSDGQGNDYSVSAIVDGAIPAELEAFKEPPPAVKAYLAKEHTGLNGWSTLK